MNTGWNFFFALILSVIVGGVSSFALNLVGWTPWLVGAIVFVIMVVFLSILSITRRKKKAEEATLEDKNGTRKK